MNFKFVKNSFWENVMTSENVVNQEKARIWAKGLLAISARHKEIFASEAGYRQKDEAWLSALKAELAVHGLDADLGNVNEEYKETLLAALALIDGENAERSTGEAKQYLHEDVVRAVLWNKGTSTESDLRRRFLEHECARVPVTGYGAFRLFYSENPRSYLSSLFSFWSKTQALDALSDLEVLLITRRDKMKGLLGGLVDLVDLQKPVNETMVKYIEERLGKKLLEAFGIDSGNLPEITAQDALGKTVTQSADGIFNKIQDRVAIEAIDAASVPLKILLAEFIKHHYLTAHGRADDVDADKNGILHRLNMSDSANLGKIHARASQGEAIEELSNVFEALEQAEFLNDTQDQRDIRAALMEQLKGFIEKLRSFEKEKADIAEKAGKSWTITKFMRSAGIIRAAVVKNEPFEYPLVKLPIDSVWDNNFMYELWVPKDFDDALRPQKFPKVRLTKPMGALQRLNREIFYTLHRAGVEASAVLKRIRESGDANLIKAAAELEVRGLQSYKATDAVAMCGSTTGPVCEKETGFDANNFRYQHEWAAPLYLIVLRFIQKPLPLKTADKSVIQAVGELQQKIINDAKAAGTTPYLFQISTALRMMAGGRLLDADAADAKVISEAFGLEKGTLLLAQKAAIDVMKRNGYDVSAVRFDEKGNIAYTAPLEDAGYARGPQPCRVMVAATPKPAA